MFATPASKVGTICGWSPSDDHPDTLYITIPADASTSQLTLSPPPSSTPPRVLRNRNPISRSLSLDSDLTVYEDCPEDINAISRFNNATSLRRYRAKRSKDPKWAPRPPNAFILFRRDFVDKNKGVKLSSVEETLSKRAGKAWRALTTDEQKAYFDAAKAEADEHLRRNPDYQFRPVKHNRSDLRRHPARRSRREQVEEFIRQASRRRAVNSRGKRDECSTPSSATSPEPPGTPSGHGLELHVDVRSRSQSRSDSVPSEPQVCATPGSEDELGYFSGAHVQSTPSLVADRPLFSVPKRTWTYSYEGEVAYSPWEYVQFDDYNTDADEQSIQEFDSVPNDPSPVVYIGDASPQQMSPNEFGAQLQMPEPMLKPTTHPDPSMPLSSSASRSHIPPSSSLLFERRQHAAEMPMVPSPLTVVTSSLSNWSRDDLVTARMVPSYTTSTPPFELSPPPQPQHLVGGFVPHVQVTESGWNQQMPLPDVYDNNLLAIPNPQFDLDRTPRAFLLQNSQSLMYTGMPPYSLSEYDLQSQSPVHMLSSEPMSMPAHSDIPFDITGDLESYQIGLRTFGINLPQQELYVATGYGAVDYSPYCHGGTSAQLEQQS